VSIKAEDRERFILDCQESFRFGSLEEFGDRNTHLDKDGEVMPRSEIEAVIDSPTAESYLIVDDGKTVGGVVIDLDAGHSKGDLTLLFTNANAHSRGGWLCCMVRGGAAAPRDKGLGNADSLFRKAQHPLLCKPLHIPHCGVLATDCPELVVNCRNVIILIGIVIADTTRRIR